MSQTKSGKVLPNNSLFIFEQEIIRSIRTALREDFPNIKAVAKAIASQSDGNLETIKRWYNGQNAPNSAHLIVLARNSFEVFKMLLKLVHHEYLIPHIEHASGTGAGTVPNAWRRLMGDKSVTIQVSISPGIAGQLNQRQLWFLGKLQQRDEVKVSDIAALWCVTMRTAKRDVADLKKRKLVIFVGAGKTGRYILS